MESSKANRKTAAEAIELLVTAYGSSSYLQKMTDQIVEMKNMVSRIPESCKVDILFNTNSKCDFTNLRIYII